MRLKKVLLVVLGLALVGRVGLPESLRVRKEAVRITGGWLGNDRSFLKESVWFDNHRYGDCPRTGDGFWPAAIFDCLIPDQLKGPSESDKMVVPEPSDLYYKHFSPTDFLRFLLLAGEVIRGGTGFFGTMSVDSLMVGLEGGNEGELIRSVSLMVHPQLENLILKMTESQARVKVFYQPFVEGAIGRKLTLEELEGVNRLYLAALNRCGRNNTDQTGLGQRLDLDNFWVVVQLWSAGDRLMDCNLHVVAKR